MKVWQLQPVGENTCFNSAVTKTNVVFLLAAAHAFADVFSSRFRARRPYSSQLLMLLSYCKAWHPT